MKTNIFTHAILAAGCAAALSGCDDNAWNDKLDGFEEPTITDVKATEYTLTADNYKAIASNKDNKALAGEELAAVLAAVGTNACFTEKIDARDYVPAFLNSTTPFSDFYSNGSVAMSHTPIPRALTRWRQMPPKQRNILSRQRNTRPMCGKATRTISRHSPL